MSHFLVSKVLAYEHNCVAAVGRIPKEMYVVADGLRRVAVVADAVNLTRGLDIESGGIGGRSGAACSCQSILNRLRNLVEADDKNHLLGTPGDGSHTVAVAVNVHNDAILRNGIGAGQVDISRKRLQVHILLLLGSLDQVAVQNIQRTAFFKKIGDAKVAHRHGAAPSHAASVLNKIRNLLDSLLGRCTIIPLNVAYLQILYDGLSQPLIPLLLWCHNPSCLNFKVQAAALNGVGADFGIGHCHVGGVLCVGFERLVAFQGAVQHDIGVR